MYVHEKVKFRTFLSLFLLGINYFCLIINFDNRACILLWQIYFIEPNEYLKKNTCL